MPALEDGKLADTIDLAAQLVAAGLAHDDLLVRMFPLAFGAWTGAAGSALDLAHRLAERRGDTLRLAPDADEGQVAGTIGLLAIFVAYGVDPCRLSSTVFRDRADAEDLALLVVSAARKHAYSAHLGSQRWRSEWPYSPDPEPVAADAAPERPAPALTAVSPFRVRNISSCVRGMHSYGEPFRRGSAIWATCAGCGVTSIAPPNGPTGAYDRTPPQPLGDL